MSFLLFQSGLVYVEGETCLLRDGASAALCTQEADASNVTVLGDSSKANTI